MKDQTNKNLDLFKLEFIQQKNYWLNKLESIYEKTTFQFSDDNMENSFDEFNTSEFKIPDQLAEKIINLSNQSDLAIYIILLTFLKQLINFFTSNKDISIVSPVYSQDKVKGSINSYVIICNSVDHTYSFRDLLKTVSEITLEAYDNQEYPFDEVLDALNMQTEEISDIACLLENVHECPITIKNRTNTLFVFKRKGKKISYKLFHKWNTKDNCFVEFIHEYYVNIVSQTFENVDLPLCEYDLLLKKHKDLLGNLNNKGFKILEGKNIIDFFEDQTERNPEIVTIVTEDKYLTYSELNSRANQMANFLKRSGVERDTIVAAILDDPIDIALTTLGIMKAGGIFMPIGIDYPDDRVNYILKDSNVKYIISPKSYNGRCSIDPSQKAITQESDRNLNIYNRLNNAYIIYTSGTTGTPKGVIVGHKSIINTILYRNEEYQFKKEDVSLQLFSSTFDGFFTSFLSPLLSGVKIIYPFYRNVKNVVNIGKIIEQHEVTHAICMPEYFFSLYLNLDPDQLSSLKTITLAGDKINAKKVQKIYAKNNKIEIVNEYGVTEAAVMSTIFHHQEKDPKIKIGSPIGNTVIHILNKSNQKLPVNIPGELCISGVGVAYGYINNPELTAERFVKEDTGEIIYHSGDSARWLYDGNLEIIGRIDDQIKIRGFRIEPKEIENHLIKHAAVSEVVVTDKLENGSKNLVAFVVLKTKTTHESLRDFLADKLPNNMIPSSFIGIDEMPISRNGKIDRKALLKINTNLIINNNYKAPTSKIGEILCKVYGEVLGKERVGINDNFFMLGGDSIRTIQIASRLNQEGYKISTQDIYNYPNIEELIPFIQSVNNFNESKEIIGIIPLTPVQKWFFGNFDNNRHLVNQNVMFHIKEPIDENMILKIFQELQRQHDVLRITFNDAEGEVIQENHSNDFPVDLRSFDLRTYNEPQTIIEQETKRIQENINMDIGPLMRVGHFKLLDGDRLFIAIHHLVVDGVSWRTLFEDIAQIYNAIKQDITICLPPKTDSYKNWSEKLLEYSNSSVFLSEIDYWLKQDVKYIPKLNLDFDAFKVKVNKTKSTFLDNEYTELLLTKANNAYKTSINDLLLCSLGLAIKSVLNNERIIVSLESHGRELQLNNINIERTVGWFTAIYPVVLDFSGAEDIDAAIKNTKETLHLVPNGGIGYGILKYLTNDEYKTNFKGKLDPQISFNYLGSFDQDIAKMGDLSIAKEKVGKVDIENNLTHNMDVVGLLTNNKLYLNLTYSKEQFRTKTIDKLLDKYLFYLKEIIDFCTNKEYNESTPSDFMYDQLSLEELDDIKSLFD